MDTIECFDQIESIFTILHFTPDDVELHVLIESAIVKLLAPQCRMGRFFRYPAYQEFHPFFLVAYATRNPAGDVSVTLGFRSTFVLFLRLLELPTLVTVAGCLIGMIIGQVAVNIVGIFMLIGMVGVWGTIRLIAWAFWSQYSVIRAAVVGEIMTRVGVGMHEHGAEDKETGTY